MYLILSPLNRKVFRLETPARNATIAQATICVEDATFTQTTLCQIAVAGSLWALQRRCQRRVWHRNAITSGG